MDGFNPSLAVGGFSHRGLGKIDQPNSIWGILPGIASAGKRDGIEAQGKRETKSADPREKVRAERRVMFIGRGKLPRGARVAAIRTNAVIGEIMPASAGEALFAVPFVAVWPFGSPALASPIFLQCVANVIVVAVLP